MDTLQNERGAAIVLDMVESIHKNEAWLSEIDGATGDGDHGANMDKGFALARDRIDDAMSLSESMLILSDTLMMDIGGSMGPIYGTLFSALGETLRKNPITASDLSRALSSALRKLKDLAGAQEGDKTLVDTLSAASQAFDAAVANGQDFYGALDALECGAKQGMESTKSMVARIGRAARLRERSRGHLDAGAVSCCIILTTFAKSVRPLITLCP